ncbi:MAG TPA: protease pro-enzyme activation domain-containing protein [Bryobacteraceae bacterium]|nr:protease pro-enzyme activation domain-containing protein [Bryobacteraceae bacterium]
MERTAIPGSAPDHAGYRRDGAADPATRMRVTVVLRLHDDPSVAAALLSGKYDASAHAPSVVDEEGKAAVEAFARANGLAVEESDASMRRVVVAGTADQMSRAFGVAIGQFTSSAGTCLSYDGAITLPPSVAGYVLAVLGLDTRPVARVKQS